MLSKLGEKIQELGKLINENEPDKPILLESLREIQDMQAPFYEEFDFGLLYENVEALVRLAATNMLASKASEQESPSFEAFQLVMQLHPLLNNDIAKALMMFSMKQAIILYQAEQRAKKQASAGLAHWVVATEPLPESNPNPDQPAQPPSELH